MELRKVVLIPISSGNCGEEGERVGLTPMSSGNCGGEGEGEGSADTNVIRELWRGGKG